MEVVLPTPAYLLFNFKEYETVLYLVIAQRIGGKC
jgi:hypothetical protein